MGSETCPRPGRAGCSPRDEARQIAAKAELCQNQQRLRWLASIVESSDDAIVSKNLDGLITSWNRGAARTADHDWTRPVH